MLVSIADLEEAIKIIRETNEPLIKLGMKFSKKTKCVMTMINKTPKCSDTWELELED